MRFMISSNLKFLLLQDQGCRTIVHCITHTVNHDRLRLKHLGGSTSTHRSIAYVLVGCPRGLIPDPWINLTLAKRIRGTMEHGLDLSDFFQTRAILKTPRFKIAAFLKLHFTRAVLLCSDVLVDMLSNPQLFMNQFICSHRISTPSPHTQMDDI